MNLKTTIVLAFLVGIGTGAGVWLTLRTKPGESTASATLDFLRDDLNANKITRIEVTRWQKPPEPHFSFTSTIGMMGQGPFAAGSMPSMQSWSVIAIHDNPTLFAFSTTSLGVKVPSERYV